MQENRGANNANTLFGIHEIPNGYFLNCCKERGKDIMKKSGPDWKRLESMRDDEIDFSDIPELDEEFFRNAEIRLPQKKQHVSMCLDAEVLDWFRKQGQGYQTRINAVLRAYVQARKKTTTSGVDKD